MSLRDYPRLITRLSNVRHGNGSQDLRDFLETTYGYVLTADALPAVANAMDDEFDDQSIAAKWTQQESGAAPTWTERNDGRLYISTAAAAGPAGKALLQAVPVGDWSIGCCVGEVTVTNDNFHKPGGLILAEGTTSQAFIYFGMANNGGNVRISRWQGSNWSTFQNETIQTVTPRQGRYFVRITKASTTYTMQYSFDGQHWNTVQSTTVSFTPATIGIGSVQENATTGMGATFKWFRRFS